MNKSLYLLFAVILLVSCSRDTGKKTSEEEKTTADFKPRYATGFEIRKDKYVTISIRNPWQNASDVEFHYRLIPRDDTSGNQNGYETIHVPVKKVVCLSTTHIGFIDVLGELNSISGISGTRFVTNRFLSEKIKNGEIAEIGYEQSLNLEMIVKLHPDVVIAYGVSGSELAYLGKIKELGIPVIYIAEYLEEDPLGKAEWIKVMGCLYNKLDLAVTRFDSTANEYNRLKKMVSGTENKPKVILGLPWQGTWYISGGESYVAKLINDAGGEYLFNSFKFKDSQPVALETIFIKAGASDFWLNTGTATNLNEIISTDERFASLKPVKTHRVYNYNRITGEQGGNAYYEQGVTEPHIILADLIHILHPDMLPSHKLKYYQNLN